MMKETVTESDLSKIRTELEEWVINGRTDYQRYTKGDEFRGDNHSKTG
ncbi:MAG: hypothetical protein ACFFC7_27895 [Candidatus Hermodarchaeota archaeon]